MLTYMGQEAVAVPCGETPVVSGHTALLALGIGCAPATSTSGFLSCYWHTFPMDVCMFTEQGLRIFALSTQLK